MQELSVQQVYDLQTGTDNCGIEGYHVDSKYFDPMRIVQQREYLKQKKGEKNRKHVTKRGNFLDDEAKVHKIIPGPGHYPKKDQWPTKASIKIHHPDKRTYIEEIMRREKKQKKPAPGQYEVEKSLKEQAAEAKRLSSRKYTVQDRITYLDNIQYQATQRPGVGQYNPRKRAKTEAEPSPVKNKPQDWRKKHEAIEKRKPPKTPDMGTYKPASPTYQLFDDLAKVKQTNKNLMGKVERFKTSASGSGLPPPRYNVIQQWRDKEKKKIDRHGLEVLSKSGGKSVYYN